MHPCDKVAFSIFDRELDHLLSTKLQPHEVGALDMYKYHALLRNFYHAALTIANVQSSFRHSGLLPLDF